MKKKEIIGFRADEAFKKELDASADAEEVSRSAFLSRLVRWAYVHYKDAGSWNALKTRTPQAANGDNKRQRVRTK